MTQARTARRCRDQAFARLSERPVGVIAAMPAEAASCGLQGSLWSLVCSGIGREAAAHSARQLAERGVAGLISWGTAGALAPDLAPGSLALYVRCVDAVSGETFDTDPTLRAHIHRLLRSLDPVECDGVTSDQPVASVAHKRALHLQYSCSAVDMESAAIAAIARAYHLPFMVIRSIVDPAHYRLPASALVAFEDPAHSVARVVGALIRRPWELGAILQLAWWYRCALGQLRAASTLLESAEWLALKAEHTR